MSKVAVSKPAPLVDIPHISKTQKEIAKEKLKELMQEESRLVRGTFMCHETPGSSVKITVRKYPGIKDGGIPHFEQVMTDGQTYEIPLYVARHLNGIDVSAAAATNEIHTDPYIGTCAYAVHGFKYNGQGMPPPGQEAYCPSAGNSIVPIIGIAKRVKRYSFASTEFAV